MKPPFIKVRTLEGVEVSISCLHIVAVVDARASVGVEILTTPGVAYQTSNSRAEVEKLIEETL